MKKVKFISFIAKKCWRVLAEILRLKNGAKESFFICFLRYKYSWQNDEIMKLRQKLANAGVSTENIASRSLSTGSIQRPPSPRRR